MKKISISTMITIIVVVLLITPVISFGAVISPFLVASNVRSYNFSSNTGLIIQVGGYTVDSNCDYPDHLQISVGDPGYNIAVKLFLSQWTKDKNIQFRIYYTPGECSQGINNGNVKIQGFYFE